jgi:drug/metabolite transporter (DMT)-like permease
MLVGFSGLYLVVFQGLHFSTFVNSRYLHGNLIALIAPVSIAFGTIYLKRHIHAYGAFTMVFLQVLVSSLALALVLSFSSSLPPWPALNAPMLMALAGLGTVATIVPYFLYNKGIERIGVSRTASFKLLIPVFTALLAWGILAQSISWPTVFGMFLSIIGVYLVNTFKNVAAIEMEQKI